MILIIKYRVNGINNLFYSLCVNVIIVYSSAKRYSHVTCFQVWGWGDPDMDEDDKELVRIINPDKRRNQWSGEN